MMLRRIGAAALAMLALISAVGVAEVYCVVAPGVVALVDETGADRVENGRFEALFAVEEGELYAAGSPGDYQLINADGEPVGESRFAMLYGAAPGCVLFRQGRRYGAMDAAGRVIVPAEWTQLWPDGRGGFLALEGEPLDDREDALIHISADGEAEPTGLSIVGRFSPLMSDRMPVAVAAGRYGAVDGLGNLMVPAEWLYIGGFEGGLAIASGPGGYGLIDAQGDVILAAEYDWMDRSEAMIVARTADGALKVFAPDGTRLRFSVPRAADAALVGEYVAVSDGERSRLYDVDGRVVREASPEAVWFPGSSGQVILSDGTWGERCQRLIHPDGSAASEGYQRLLPLCEGRYAWLSMSGTEYYSEDLGGLQTSWDYDSVRCGLMNANGVALTDADYLEIRSLGRDRLLMIDGQRVCFADIDGHVLREWITAEPEAASGEADAGGIG